MHGSAARRSPCTVGSMGCTTGCFATSAPARPARRPCPAPTSPRWKRSGLLVDLRALLHKLHRLRLHPLRKRFLVAHAVLRGVVAHVLRDLHRAEVRAAHGAEVRELGAFLGKRLVVELLRL